MVDFERHSSHECLFSLLGDSELPVAAPSRLAESSSRSETIVLHHNTYCCKALHTLASRIADDSVNGLNRGVDIFCLTTESKSRENRENSMVRCQKE
jgi:hypothetical protein